MKKSCYILLMLILLSIWTAGCTRRSTNDLLAKAESMQNISTDSMLFYLQQIRQPNKMTGSTQANYCFLLYKSTLWGTGKVQDSLLQRCIPLFLQTKDTAQWINARVVQANSFLYTQQPDSALLYVARIQKEQLKLSDSLKIKLYAIARAAYVQKEWYLEALQIADSSLALASKTNDTLLLYHSIRLRLQIVEKMNRNEEFVEGSEKLMQQLESSVKYRSLNRYTAEALTAFHLRNKDFIKALKYSNIVRHSQRSRNDVPYYQLLRGRIYEAINNIDSAKVYYTLASNSLSDYVAAEATASLYQLIDANEYPEQAFYIAQKEKEIHQHLESVLGSQMNVKKYNETKLQNELYQLRLSQQEKELLMMGIAVVLLLMALIVLFFYQREKKKRLLSEQNLRHEQAEEKTRQLQHENLLLHKEAELSALREKEAYQRNKEHELREAIFRRISFFHKLPSLQADTESSSLTNRKIEVTDTEWKEVRSAINDGFDNFAVRLQQAYPQLTEKEIHFCCLVKINVNMQDLSDIYCVSKAAITKRKYRIKTEKFRVSDENSSLDQILQMF